MVPTVFGSIFHSRAGCEGPGGRFPVIREGLSYSFMCTLSINATTLYGQLLKTYCRGIVNFETLSGRAT